MLQYRVLDRSPNISVALDFTLPATITELSCTLNLSSAIGDELRECPMTERSLDTTLNCSTEYLVTMTVSNGCGSDDTNITIPPQGKCNVGIINFQYHIVPGKRPWVLAAQAPKIGGGRLHRRCA